MLRLVPGDKLLLAVGLLHAAKADERVHLVLVAAHLLLHPDEFVHIAVDLDFQQVAVAL